LEDPDAGRPLKRSFSVFAIMLVGFCLVGCASRPESGFLSAVAYSPLAPSTIPCLSQRLGNGTIGRAPFSTATGRPPPTMPSRPFRSRRTTSKAKSNGRRRRPAIRMSISSCATKDISDHRQPIGADTLRCVRGVAKRGVESEGEGCRGHVVLQRFGHTDCAESPSAQLEGNAQRMQHL
jgi:hypothetical protein